MRLGSLLLAACLIACCVHVRAFSVSSAWFRDRSAGLMEVETTSRGRLPTNRRPSYPRAMARSEQRKSAQIWSRREVIASPLILGPVLLPTSSRGETSPQLVKVSDPATYSALTYAPRGVQGKLPLIVVLHGAGKNEKDVWNLADPQDEHAGLAPSLLASGRAPSELADNFALIAPYSQGKKSFYEEPRKKLLQFVEWVCSDEGRKAGCPDVDPNRIFLFGFSDGATVGVELLTTKRFKGAIIAAYGYTGTLPPKAQVTSWLLCCEINRETRAALGQAERLKGIPVWVFHSADDVIFDVQNSDNLVRALRKVNGPDSSLVKYTRFERDQEGFTGAVQGHSTGITATRTPQVYSWLLSL